MRDVSIEEWTVQENEDSRFEAEVAAQACIDELDMKFNRFLWMMVPGLRGSPVVIVFPTGKPEYEH